MQNEGSTEGQSVILMERLASHERAGFEGAFCSRRAAHWAVLALGVSGRLISFLAGLSAGLGCSACCSTTKIFNVCAEHHVIDDLASDWSPLGSIGSGRQRYIKQLPGRPVGWPGLLRLLKHRCLLSMHPPSNNRIPAGSKCQLYDAFGQK